MTDYATHERKRFLRHLKLLAFLRALSVALVGLSVGATVAAVLILFTRKP